MEQPGLTLVEIQGLGNIVNLHMPGGLPGSYIHRLEGNKETNHRDDRGLHSE